MKQKSGDSLSLSGAIIQGQTVFALVLTILRILNDTKLLGKGKQREISISRRAIPRSLRTSSNGEETLTLLQVYKEIRDAFLLLPYLYRTIISLPDLSLLSRISHGLDLSIPLSQLPRNILTILRVFTPAVLAFITWPSGPQKQLAPGPVPHPAPLNGPGRACLLGLPFPPLQLRPFPRWPL